MKLNNLTTAIQAELSGAKGGDTARKSVESPDSLISIAQARIIDLISEGEIEGFPSGANFLRDIYLDETPIENADGTRNFKSLTVEARTGTQTQSYIPGFSAVENELGIGVELRQDTPWVRSFTNLQLSAINVRLGIGPFYKTNSENGDITGTIVDYAIDVATDGGPFVEKMVSRFNGKATEYERGHRIDLPTATTSGWIIRVRRLTADTSTLYLSDDTSVISVTEIIDAKLRYPMSAIVGLQFDASQFQSIPTRAYRVKGRRIRVPVNYDPETRTYSGPWNGTFKIAYSNNPAWVFYDLTTHPRYGLGKLVTDLQIDKYSLYAIAQYCDTLVSDGFGGTEPRMVCNLYLQQAADAWKVVGDLASIFRGICFWAGGAIVPIADRPTDPVYTYTNGNVVNGVFSYQSSGRKARHTAVLVSYNDMANFGKLKTDYYDDPEMIARFGFQQTEIVALGASSPGQAQRMARWLLLSEKILTNTCSWSVGLDGTWAVPGQVVRVADKWKAGKRTGGRVKTATTTSVTLDQAPSPAPVNGDTLTIILPTGVSQTRTINSVTGGGSILGVSSAFSAAPISQSVWAVESTALKNQLYKILSVKPGENGSFELTGLQHDQELFDAVDAGTPITPDPVSMLPSPNQVRPATLTITSVERAGEIVAMPLLTAAWPATPGAVRYQIQWRKDSGEWTPLQEIQGTTADFQNPFPGVWEAKVQAINALGIVSIPKFSAPYTLADPTTSPGFVAALNASVADAIATAEEAMDLAEAVSDGGIQSYFQASAPTGLAAEDVGDLWFDSDDGNKIYRWSGSAWVATPDSAIAAAIAAAATAQATADGKVKTFIQAAPPSATGVGDLWIESDMGNRLHRASAVGTGSWVLIQDTGIAAALAAAANAQATADGNITSFWQTTAPTIGSGAGQAQVGDIWFDTDDGNKVWRVVGAAWVDAQDDALAAALAAASTAQATADGKVKTFFAPDASPPTATAIGDLWFKTTSLVLVRWNGTTWGDIIGDVTAGQLGGTGLNMLWDEYTQFRNTTPPSLSLQDCTAVTVSDATAIGGYALRMQTSNTTTSAFMALAPVWSTSISPISGSKFIISFYARASVANHVIRAELFEGSTGVATSSDITITNTTGWTRYSVAVTASPTMVMGNLILRVNRSGVSGRQVFFDRIMVEQKFGNLSTPSPWVPGNAGIAAQAARIAAATAQAAADGTVDIYRQSTAPTFGPAKAGDYWQDSDDNKWYYSPSGSSWTEVTDPRIPQAISDAAAAQSTANSRIRTFYASSAPTPTAVGDLWYNTSTSVLSRWDGSAWVNVADNSVAALNPNVINPGFEQGLLGWADGYGAGLSGWSSSTPAVAPSGTKVLIKSGGTAGSTGIVNNATIAVSAGDTIMVRCTVKADSNPVGGVEIGMAWYTAAGAFISWVTGTADFTKDYCNGVWKEFIKAVLVPGNAVLGRAFVAVHGYTGTGTWSFDSVRADTLADASAGLNIAPNSEWIQNLTRWNGLSSIGTLAEAKYATGAILADNVQMYYYTDLTTDLTASIGKKISAQVEVMVIGTTSVNTFAFLRMECFNVSSASLGYRDSLIYGLGGTTQIPVTVDTWNRLTVNGLTVPTGTTKIRFMVVVRGNGTFRIRKPKIERGEFATAYSPSADIVWGSQLVVSGSGMRIGDQRNLLQSLVNAYGAVSDAVPITATSAGAVSINAFTVKMGGSSVTYNAVSNAVTGLTVGTTYAIYCFDAAFAGGTRTWYASSGSYAALMSLGDDLVVAGVVTIPSSGSSGGGSGGSTPDDDPACVHWDTYLPDGRLVRDLKVGDMVTCINVLTGTVDEFPVLKMGVAHAPCYRLTTPELCSVVQSEATAMDLPGGGVAKTTEMLGKKVVICKNGEYAEDICMDVQFLGIQPVVKIDLGDRMFFAGESPGATIATHNIRFK